MIPIGTPAEMRAIDAAAPEPIDVLIDRAAAAVARTAEQMLGGTYGRRVVVIAGKGMNGEDGRRAAAKLIRRGVRVRVVPPDQASVVAPRAMPHLVIDAAYGTGLNRPWTPPDVGDIPVLAVDIPSGVDGLTGEIHGGAIVADRTITFAGLKPGLLLLPGAAFTGDIEVADIGLDTSSLRSHLMTDADVAALDLTRPATTHKWRNAVAVIAGSPGMEGAGALTAAAAARSGASYVQAWTLPGVHASRPPEATSVSLPATGWLDALAAEARLAAVAIGPGLGRSDTTAEEVRAVVTGAAVPIVADADAIAPLAVLDTIDRGDVVLTPHDGEFARLMGAAPGVDRFAAARAAAARFGVVVLLKGPTTVVATPDGATFVSTAGDTRLATAGSGDVLTGVIVGLLSRGIDAARAAALGAHVHGRAAEATARHGMVAGDLIDRLPEVFSALG